MKNYIRTGKGSAESAVSSATSGLNNPSAIIFFADYYIIGDVGRKLKEKYPEALIMGTIGTKLVNGEVDDKGLSVMAFFDDVKVSSGIIKNLSECPIIDMENIEKKAREIGSGKDDTVCIEFCTNDEEMLVTTLNACLGRKGISLAGGTVFGAPEGKAGIVSYNGVLYENACVYTLIKNLKGKVKVFKENIYEKKSNIHHFATKVDTETKALIEIDGEPAAEVYSREVGVDKENIIDNVFKNPMGRVVGNEVYISSMKELGPDGIIYNYKCINRNDCIYFLELGDYDAIERENREKIKREMGHVSCIFSIDCVYRYLMYSDEKYFGKYAKDMASLGAHMGFVSGGEQYNNQHVNQTMICVAFE